MRRLRPIPNLDRDLVLRKLRTKQLGQRLEVLDKCTSTNDVAAQHANPGAPHGYTVLSEEQTAGRGRQGRTWLSPRGGIWLTTLLRPPLINLFSRSNSGTQLCENNQTRRLRVIQAWRICGQWSRQKQRPTLVRSPRLTCRNMHPSISLSERFAPRVRAQLESAEELCSVE